MKLLGRMGFFSRKPPPFDYEKAVGKLLLETPRLSANVVIVTRAYGEKHFTCQIVANPKLLLPWAEKHADYAWHGSEVGAAGMAFPLLLRGADLGNNEFSYIPVICYDQLRAYATQFVKEGIARVICDSCKQTVDPIKKREDLMQGGGYSEWIDDWTCPCGAQLYHQYHWMHFHIRRS